MCHIHIRYSICWHFILTTTEIDSWMQMNRWQSDHLNVSHQCTDIETILAAQRHAVRTNKNMECFAYCVSCGEHLKTEEWKKKWHFIFCASVRWCLFSIEFATSGSLYSLVRLAKIYQQLMRDWHQGTQCECMLRQEFDPKKFNTKFI